MVKRNKREDKEEGGKESRRANTHRGKRREGREGKERRGETGGRKTETHDMLVRTRVLPWRLREVG